MEVLLSTEITPATLVSTTAPERLPGQAEWVQQAYAANAVVTVSTARRVYRAAFAVPADALRPDVDVAESQIPYWLDVGPMNQWSMFDGQVGTQTTQAGDMTVVLRPGGVSSVWLGNLTNVTSAHLVVRSAPGGPIVYEEDRSAIGTVVVDWWDYWFGDIVIASDMLFSGIPVYRNCEVTITIRSGGDVGVGMLAVGSVETLGCTQWGPETDFRNYSARTLDSRWGPSEGTGGVVTRDQAYRVFIKPADAPRVSRFMDGAMKRPAVWIPSGDPRFEGIRVFGQAVGSRITYPSPNVVLLSLNIRGFI